MQDFEVNLICVEYGIDSSKDSGKLMIYVLSAVTEIEGLEKQHRQLTGANIRIWIHAYIVCMMKLKAWRTV